jgi:hypothetical protein
VPELRCEACGSTDGASVRPVPLKTVACDACWGQASAGFPSREPERPDYALAIDLMRSAAEISQSNLATCKNCGAEGAWHRTLHGHWMIMEPGEYPTFQIPSGKRWRIGGDGTAVNLGRGSPSDTCRISHFDVCPAKPPPADGKVLLAIWRSRRKA